MSLTLAYLAGASIAAYAGNQASAAAGADDRTAAGTAYRRQKTLQERAYNFSREFRQTAHQDTTADLEAAGLNRILSISQGATSSPMASTPTAPHAAGTGSASRQAGAAVSRSMSAARQVASQALVNKAQARNLEEDAQLKTATKIKTIEEAVNASVDRRRISADADAARSNATRAAFGLHSAKHVGDYYKGPAGKTSVYSQEAAKSIGALLGPPSRRMSGSNRGSK